MLDTFRTCRVPVLHITFPGFETVVKPVSSQFQMRVALYSPVCRISLYSPKNPITASRLKPSTRAIGARIDRDGCRLIVCRSCWSRPVFRQLRRPNAGHQLSSTRTFAPTSPSHSRPILSFERTRKYAPLPAQGNRTWDSNITDAMTL